MTSISLSYSGNLADNNFIDMYDGARALGGFQRSLALTTHLLLNGEIITQAPSLKGAQIITSTPEEGSWKVTAMVIAGLWTVAVAPKDTVPGHLLFSAYDYVVNMSLGFHVDYEKSLGQQYEEHLAAKKITPEKFDSLLEKTESSFTEMHRPIVASKTASRADLVAIPDRGASAPIGPQLTYVTWDYLTQSKRLDLDTPIEGVVSSFNINTTKGRIFVFEEGRPIAFELAASAKTGQNILALASSLRANAAKRTSTSGGLRLYGRRFVSSTGRLKSLVVTSVVVSDE